MNDVILTFVGLGVMDKLVNTELEKHKEMVKDNFKWLGIQNYKGIEG